MKDWRADNGRDHFAIRSGIHLVHVGEWPRRATDSAATDLRKAMRVDIGPMTLCGRKPRWEEWAEDLVRVSCASCARLAAKRGLEVRE